MNLLTREIKLISKHPGNVFSYTEAIEKKTGIDVLNASLDEIKSAAKKAGIEIGSINSKANLSTKFSAKLLNPK
jgi:hypothetical protein